MSNFKNIREYFNDSRPFIVPYYQRGYKWSLQTNEKRRGLHLELLLSDLEDEYMKARDNGRLSSSHEYYLQGITVKENGHEIELVDGQQRTTSLFILLACLQQQGITKEDIRLRSKLKYRVRRTADKTLQQFIDGHCKGDDNIQDVAALKKAWKMCCEMVSRIDNPELFGRFLLENIKIIYITLETGQKETTVFSMMNQAKAEMTQTDLVKSNLLREASRQMFDKLNGRVQNDGLEWQINQMRTKQAGEWDNWRKWWVVKEHQDFTKMIAMNLPARDSDEPELSALLKFHSRTKEKEIRDTDLFDYFKGLAVKRENNIINALEVFSELRTLQNIIEEWYGDVEIYNHLGLLFKGCGLSKREKMLLELYDFYLFSKKKFVSELRKRYTAQILNDYSDPEDFIRQLVDDREAYYNQYTSVARQLLRMNVMMAGKQQQKFDFTLYEEDNFTNADEIKEADKRSLEHILPQSARKVSTRLKNLTHKVGNLVLLPKGLNSKLSNKKPEDKKQIVFDEMLNPKNKNYGLWLHTLSVFGSNSRWQEREIKKNAKFFKDDLTDFFQGGHV